MGACENWSSRRHFGASQLRKGFKKFTPSGEAVGEPSSPDVHLQKTVAVQKFTIPAEAVGEPSSPDVHLQKTVAVQKFTIPAEAVGEPSSPDVHPQKTVAVRKFSIPPEALSDSSDLHECEERSVAVQVPVIDMVATCGCADSIESWEHAWFDAPAGATERRDSLRLPSPASTLRSPVWRRTDVGLALLRGAIGLFAALLLGILLIGIWQ
jgi:hypothetical protein